MPLRTRPQPPFGARIANARKRRHWTQVDLATHAGLTPRTIEHLECGTRGGLIETLAAIAEALDVSMDELYWGSPQERWQARAQ